MPDYPSSLPFPDKRRLDAFLQQMANRAVVGHVRYGRPDTRKRYMSRIEKELEVYKSDGNREQLLNIAVYCFLESVAPEHPSHHHDATTPSATRRKFGGARA